MKIAAIALALCAGLAATATAAQSDDAAPTPHSNICFLPSHIRSTTPISENEILFTMNDGKIWKNTLRANCPGLKFEGGFSWTIRGDTVCSNAQMIQVLRRGNSCFLGEFSPYTPPPKADTN